MNMYKNVVLCAMIVMMMPGCNWFSGSSEPVRLRLVNVLDLATFKDAHIKGGKSVESVQVDFNDLEKNTAQWDKTVPVVVYCSNYFCTASGDAARKLQELGFLNVYAYEGGIAEWYQMSLKNSIYQVEGKAEKPYLKIEVKKPHKDHQGIRVITAKELQAMIVKE